MITHLQFLSDEHLYRVIPRVLIFVMDHNRVLLLKGAPNKRLWPNRYNGVGGHLEPGETVRDAAIRELREETGLTASRLVLSGIVNVSQAPPQDGIMLFIFTCHTDKAEPTPSREGTLQWFAWDELPTDELVSDLPVLLPLIQNAPQSSQPFYALYTYDQAGHLDIHLST